MTLAALKRPGDIVAEILMSRTVFKGSFLVVEGEGDSRFWRGRIDQKKCQTVTAGGKQTVIKSIEVIDGRRIAGTLGIIDDDYDSLLGVAFQSGNLVATDSHDIETMLIASSAFDRLVAEVGDPDRIREFETKANMKVRDAALQRALPYGRLRWLSAKAGLCIPFEQLNIRKFIPAETWALDQQALITEAAQLGTKGNEAALTSSLNALPTADPWTVCCGHDLVAVLDVGFHRVLANRSPGPRLIFTFLRVAYQDSELAKTGIWKAIKDWESQNIPYVILPGGASREQGSAA